MTLTFLQANLEGLSDLMKETFRQEVFKREGKLGGGVEGDLRGDSKGDIEQDEEI